MHYSKISLKVGLCLYKLAIYLCILLYIIIYYLYILDFQINSICQMIFPAVFLYKSRSGNFKGIH